MPSRPDESAWIPRILAAHVAVALVAGLAVLANQPVGAVAGAGQSAEQAAVTVAAGASVRVEPYRVSRARRTPPTAPAALPPPPPAPSCVDADPKTRGERVLATLPDDWKSSGYPVRFSGPREGYYGEVRHEEPVVEVYVRSCARESDELLRHVIAHEFGHARDLTAMDDTLRAAYMEARGLPAGTPWFGCSGCTDFETPAGDFAETYGQWLRGGTNSKSRLARPAAEAELANLAARFFA